MIVARPHPASIDPAELLRSCTIRRSRSSGPGGQHRNKVETAITIIHEPTGVLASATERRSAEENRRVAIGRLRLALAVEVRTPVPEGDQRSELWRSRATGGSVRVSARHEDYPAMIAEALDMTLACAGDAGAAAARLVCSPSQLLKLLRSHAPALAAVNRERVKSGLHPYK